MKNYTYYKTSAKDFIEANSNTNEVRKDLIETFSDAWSSLLGKKNVTDYKANAFEIKEVSTFINADEPSKPIDVTVKGVNGEIYKTTVETFDETLGFTEGDYWVTKTQDWSDGKLVSKFLFEKQYITYDVSKSVARDVSTYYFMENTNGKLKVKYASAPSSIKFPSAPSRLENGWMKKINIRNTLTGYFMEETIETTKGIFITLSFCSPDYEEKVGKLQNDEEMDFYPEYK